MPDDLLTAQEAADYLKVKKTTVYELVKRGDLPSTKIGKQLRIPRAALEGMTGAVRADEPPRKPPIRESGRPGAILCGQDSSLDMIADFVTASAGNGAVVLRSHAGSYNSLTMLYHGKVDMATAHLWDEATGTYNLPYISKLLPGMEVTAVRLFGRTTGIYVPTGNPRKVEGVSALARPELRMINREKGSGIRIFIDEMCKKLDIDPDRIHGYEDIASSHLIAATNVLRGTADVAIGNEKSARQMEGIQFLPLKQESYDIVFRKKDLKRKEFQNLLNIIGSEEFQKEAEMMSGYDISDMGKQLY